MNEEFKGIVISRKYTELFKNYDSRYSIVTGGRGSSKSFSISLFLLMLSYEKGHRILFTRYTLTSASISIIPEFIEKIELIKADSDFRITKDSIVNKTTGSEILFKGIKTSSGTQTASLKSLQGVTTWVLDEAEELTDEFVFDKIDLSVRHQAMQNRIILILNPATKEHWIYKRFFEEKGIEGGFNGVKDNACYIHTTYLDNEENLSDSFLTNIKWIKENRPDKYKFQILGGWRAKAEGVIFEWEYGTFDDSLPFWYGLDFGFVNDPDACVKVAIDEKRNILYLHEEFYEYGQTSQRLADKVRKLKGNIIADSAEQRLINSLSSIAQKSITPTKKGAGSVLQGVKLMKDYKIVVSEGSKNLAIELNNYCWNGKAKEAPIDDYNHLIDAARYVVFTNSKISEPKHFKIDNQYTKFIKGDATGFNASPWNADDGKSNGDFF